MSKGYLLIAFGIHYVEEAVCFTNTLRKFGDTNPVSILCRGEDLEFIQKQNVFTDIIKYDFDNEFASDNKTNFESLGGTPKILMSDYLIYDETIFLDSDMLVQSNPSKVWEYLKSMNQSYVLPGGPGDINDELIKNVAAILNIESDNVYSLHSGMVYINKKHSDFEELYSKIKFFWKNYYDFGLGCRLFRNGKADEHAYIAAYNSMNYKPINPTKYETITHNYHHDIELPSNIVTGGSMYNIQCILSSPPPFIHMFKEYGKQHYNILYNRLINL